MPDDNQVTEQEVDEYTEEAEDAFAEEETTEEPKDTEKDEKQGKVDTEKVEDDKKETKPDEDKKPDGKDATDERLEKRLKEIDSPDGDTAKKPEKKEEPKEEPQKPDESETPKSETDEPTPWTKEQILEHLAVIENDELPEEVTIGNTTINVKGYAQEYPEDFNTMKIVASVIAQKMVQNVIKDMPKQDGETVPIKEFKTLQGQVAQTMYDSAIARMTDDDGNLKHPDYYQIVHGPKRDKLINWVKTQKPGVQKLAESGIPEDGDLVLDLFKKSNAKKKADEFDKKASEKKREYDNIHKSTVRTDKSLNNRPGGKDNVDPDKEAEDAFNEED